MLGSHSSSIKSKHKHYCSFNFFDTRPQFDAVFGKIPNILCHYPLRTDKLSVVKDQLREYSEKPNLILLCTLSNWITSGRDIKGDINLSIIEVYHKIQNLSQQITQNGQSTYISPEILSNQHLPPSLLD